jgi:hypothetical protein
VRGPRKGERKEKRGKRKEESQRCKNQVLGTAKKRGPRPWNEERKNRKTGPRCEGREKARGKRKEERGKFRAVTSDW